MSKGKKKIVVKPHNTDDLARNIWLNLARDFRAIHGHEFCRTAEQHLLKGAAEYRDYKYPTAFGTSTHFFRANIQLESLLKKYRFESDKFTDAQLERRTMSSYMDFQPSISTPLNITPSTYRVLQEARKIAKGILGSFDPELMLLGSKFGKKSSIGCPLSLAYIDEKLSNIKAFTGSSRCSKWFFEKVLPEDGILRRIIDRLPGKGRDGDLEHESLTLINVPKTWKILRTITPLTLIGLFYSYGIGALVTEALKSVGIDIRRQQDRHRKWIRKFSLTRSHATADLSRASDSITLELLMRILPRAWWVALKPCLTSDIEFETSRGRKIKAKTGSVLPMGNGATFPVETLIFYCIIKAIGNLSGIKGRYSVYGDDLIYPAGIHPIVVKIFPNLHFTLNSEKTFVNSDFRESCGADYFRGADVRPFFFRGESKRCTKTQYLAVLYKTYNGLIRRWDPLEIRRTLQYLLVEIANLGGQIYRVPTLYPDTAGIKVESPELIPLDCKVLNWAPIYTFFEGGHWTHFSYLAERSKDRFVKFIEPYYWLALQGLDDATVPDFGQGSYLTAYGAPPEPALTWRRFKRQRTYKHKGKIKQKTVYKYKPAVANRSATVMITGSDSVSDWI
jgi:hypothetical protein